MTTVKVLYSASEPRRSGRPQPTETAQDDQVDPVEVIPDEDRPAHPHRPWVYTNMIGSADGATAVDGVSGGLGGPADKAVFRGLRAEADSILVGASTVRQEQYRPPSPDADAQARRQRHGRPARPMIAIVTNSVSLDPDLPIFSDPDYQPLILTSEQSDDDKRRRIEALSDKAEVVVVGDENADLARALGELADRGYRTTLCEGGPSLNGQLIELDLIDEWNLSLAAKLVGGESSRPAVGSADPAGPRAMDLQRIWSADDLLFLRWVRSDRSTVVQDG